MALCVLLPVAWFVAVTRFTPLSAREWSPAFTAFIQPCIQHAALRLLVLLLPVTLARWRLGRRGVALGLAGKWLWADALCLGLVALALPLAGSLRIVGSETLLVWSALIMLGIPLAWLLALAAKLFLSSPGCALRRTVVARTVLPAWTFAMLLWGLALPFPHAEERYWTQRNEVTKVSPGAAGWTRYEARIIPIFRQETRELLEFR